MIYAQNSTTFSFFPLKYSHIDFYTTQPSDCCICVCSERFGEETTTYMVCLASAVFNFLSLLLRHMGTELLVSKALLGSGHWSSTFCRKYFDKTPEFTVLTHPANMANPHNSCLSLCIFYNFFMLWYHIRKMMAKQQPPKNCSSLLKVDRLRRTAEEITRQGDQHGQKNGKLSWLLHGC